MSLSNPAGLWALLAAVPVLLLHVLRPRRPNATVPSVLLWRSAESTVSSARPWQRLRWSVLLLLQLLTVFLLAIALARPVRPTTAPLRAHTVFVIDASGSMAATDGTPDRIGSARAAARRLRAQLPAGGIASIVSASLDPQVELSASSDRRLFDSALDRIATHAGAAHWQDAFNIAESLETPGKPLGIVVISDGHLSIADQRSIPAGSSYVKVGARTTNRAIVSLTVEAHRGTGLRAHVTVRSTGGPQARQRLRLDVDGQTRAAATITVPSGRSVDHAFDLPNGDRVEAFLEGDDLLAIDNRAYAVGSRTRAVRVLLAGPDDAFLSRMLASLPGVRVELSETSRPAPGFDLAIYNRVPVPGEPGAPFLAISPPGGTIEVQATGVVQQPSLTFVSRDPLLAGLDLSDVGIASAQQLRVGRVGRAEVLVGADETPLLVRGLHGGRPYAYLGFSLTDSNLPLQVAFPLLVDRLVHDLAGGSTTGAAVIVGDPLPVDVTQEIVLVRPNDGGTIRRPAGGSAPVADRPGFWAIRQQGRPQRVVAVNADPAESALATSDRLLIAKRPAVPGQPVPAGERSMLVFVVGALLALLSTEWIVARRRIGVSRRQWRAGAIVRVGVVACLLGALANVAIDRSNRAVSVLFAIDGSDSIGADGRSVALQWVRDALDAKPRSARAGVVVFGGDARVESLVKKTAAIDNVTVQVDRTRTNAAGVLRLAPALLPPTSKRRVVLLSDGRFTDGDAATEAERLGATHIPVDVQLVGARPGNDVAIVGVDVPSRVAVSDTYSMQAIVHADRPTTATLHVRRDDGSGEFEIATREVRLRAGETVVEVAQKAERSGVGRFRVTIDAAGDPRAENNTAFAATQVSGPAKVLVVSGTPGEADTLAGALQAGGIASDVIDATALPTLERLATYRSVILVDVDARSLVSEQIDALRAATRELGRGLVVLGGPQSYGLGGYQRSALEELLPVESDVRDPLRRKSVAEVLAIDTSGSMGACHCPGGRNGLVNGGNRAEGGVSKTDISRAAAARSIGALAAGDQVGVLAFNTQHRWVINLQDVPAQDIVNKGLASLTPRGNTNLTTPLLDAGDKLRRSKADLKHIILMTDGFSTPEALAGLAAQARQLAEEGITVSVVATGEGAAAELGLVAQSGRGRFYPGTDLLEIPEIMMQETVVASRSFVNEGEFVPSVTGSDAPVRNLDSAPLLLGYVATTAKSTAQTSMRIGPDNDPLLASWRVGLGHVVAWTSDASARWSKQWASWNGYSKFWSAVVKETFPLDEGASVRADVRGDRLVVSVESPAVFPEGATGVVRIGTPGGATREVPLERVGGDRFAAEVDAPLPGTYAVGAQIVRANGSAVAVATGLTTRSYAAEYLPGAPNRGALLDLSSRSGGRGVIQPNDAFAATGLRSGTVRHRLAPWLLFAACLLFPIDVAIRRLARRRSAFAMHVRRGITPKRIAGALQRMRARAAIEAPQADGNNGSRNGTGNGNDARLDVATTRVGSPATQSTPPGRPVRVRATSPATTASSPTRVTARPAASRAAPAAATLTTTRTTPLAAEGAISPSASDGRTVATLDRLLEAKRQKRSTPG